MIDLQRLQAERISSDTRLGIIDYFFDHKEYDIDEINELKNLDMETFPYHARALCLYAALLITKLHETSARSFEPDYFDRKRDAVAQPSKDKEFAGFGEKELESKIDEITMRDIRNCFAHGQFEINYTKGTNKLNFVLWPNKSKIVSDYPIIIPAGAISSTIKSFLADNSYVYKSLASTSSLKNGNALDSSLKDIMLPVQMLSFAEHFKDKFKNPKSSLPYNNKLYAITQYVLLSAKIAYEEDEYYQIFGKDSRIFEMISLIRNSLAHNNTIYTENATIMQYADKKRTLTESLEESTAKLLIVDSQKHLMQYLINEGKHSKEGIDAAKDALIKIYEFIFNNPDANFEEIYKAMEDEDAQNKNL